MDGTAIDWPRHCSLLQETPLQDRSSCSHSAGCVTHGLQDGPKMACIKQGNDLHDSSMGA